MFDMLQLVVEIGKTQCTTQQVVSRLKVGDLADKLKHVGHPFLTCKSTLLESLLLIC